eukprot:4250716-Ditylum_brightwellii.AAC.1
MRKCAKGHGDTCKDAVMAGQGLSLSWEFMTTTLIDSGIISSDSKSPPLGWLNHLLTKISPEHKNKYGCIDLGSELGQNEDVKTLIIKHGYDIQPTRPDALYQNSPAERPHETIGNAIRS